MAFPLIAWLAATLGRRHVFWILGGMGIAWALVWMKVIRNRPEQHPKVGENELVHITEDETSADTAARAQEKGAFRRDMAFLLRRRRIWGVFLGQFAIASTLYFFLTWFPTYLTDERGLSLDKGGLTGALPFVAALVGVLCGGSWSDWMVKRGMSASFARKTPIVTGLALAGVIVAANHVTSNAAMIAIMCVAFFANGLASFSWVLVTEIAPQRMLGVAGGVFNVFGNLAGMPGSPLPPPPPPLPSAGRRPLLPSRLLGVAGPPVRVVVRQGAAHPPVHPEPHQHDADHEAEQHVLDVEGQEVHPRVE